MEITVNLNTARRIKTAKDLNDYFAYIERNGGGFEYSWPEEEQRRVDILMDYINYAAGEYDPENVSRIIGERR